MCATKRAALLDNTFIPPSLAGKARVEDENTAGQRQADLWVTAGLVPPSALLA
jgi:hypothetical protein